ncbi:DUF2066 domain-containing protein [Hyphococcus flavus]|uniref:DUF2066 domain-containing protein n=1 Tax=Hyphococcus flavus TaxID=1866326 RepID=A0AAE9ZDI6_9PROT|nr:DUF2066 domain-containing protein [Hyphococcus flavus]WDI30952.1 DUF2066 domain-containing protein [Hyphococcus flavus]
MAASAAFAAGEDVFVVPRVTVQAQADNATAAKVIAQRRGRRRALDILLKRLTVEEDWPYLPRVETMQSDQPEEPAQEDAGLDGISPAGPDGSEPDVFNPFAYRDRPVLTLDDNALEALEAGFEVYNEKSSAQTYRAFITYRFKPAAVRRLLRDAQIPYSEAQTRTALVLPVLETANGVYLWEENNPWMAAWKVRPYNNELTPMAAPLGDLEDASSISAQEALSLNNDALRMMADRYAVSQVIIAHAFLRQVDGEHRLRVRLINGFRESGDVSSDAEFSAVDTPEASYEGLTAIQQAPETNVISAKVGDVLAESLFNRPVGNFPTMAEEAIEVVIAKHAKPWKERTLIDHTEAALLEASAYFRSLSEWAKIRSALISTPLVGSVQVRSLSRQGAEMLIQAYGDPDKLIVAMEAQGLTLWSEDGERWLVATPATAQNVRRSDRRNRRGRYGELSGPADPVRPASYEPGDGEQY